MEIENIQSIVNLKPIPSNPPVEESTDEEKLQVLIKELEDIKKEESILYHNLIDKEEKYLSSQKSVKMVQKALKQLPVPKTEKMSFLELTQEARLSLNSDAAYSEEDL